MTVPTHTYRLARLPEGQPAPRCELTELLVDQCGHCAGVHDPEEDIARASYELAARRGCTADVRARMPRGAR